VYNHATVETLQSTEACVDAILARVGRRVLLATPLGIGKPNHLLNALYRRAKADQRIELVIHTALTLVKPSGKSDLEQRFLGPMVERVFAGYPELEHELDRRAGKLPSNVRVIEFYFPAGTYMGNAAAQRDYASTNYTHVARDLYARGVNVLMQQVCAGVVDGRPKLSLSSNADVSLDLLTKLRADQAQGRAVAIAAQLNDQLPFMHGDAAVDPQLFDYVVDDPSQHFPLFGPPKLSVSDADHMIGLYGSTLVKDGGELQIGIGSLGDAVAHSLLLRHRDNALYRDVLHTLGVDSRFGGLVAALGDTGRFEKGLFAATEMLVDGFMHLF
jgi:acyl-CoA hydrolase